MMERTRIYAALKGVRGREPIDLAALERLLVRFAQLVVEQPRVREIDINPLLAAPGRLLALDARVVLHPPDLGEDRLPRPAIRPYPDRYVGTWTMAEGTTVLIRPIRPEDEPMLVRFHEALSEASVHLRYFHAMKLNYRASHERLTRICFIDYDRELALVADRLDPDGGGHEVLAVGRLSKSHLGDEAEFALLIRDGWQGRGLGTELLGRLIAFGRDERLRRITAEVLPENGAMLRICEKLGFRLRREPGVPEVRAELDLADPAPPRAG